MDGKTLKPKVLQVLKKTKILVAMATTLFLSSFIKQNDPITVKMYLVEWNTKYTVIRTIKNIKETHLFYVESKETDLNDIFLNYDDCIKKLSSQDTLSGLSAGTNAYVEICFKTKVAKLYFKDTGEYFYAGNWHKCNSALFYHLFRYFSNDLVNKAALDKAKSNVNDNLWHTNK